MHSVGAGASVASTDRYRTFDSAVPAASHSSDEHAPRSASLRLRVSRALHRHQTTHSPTQSARPCFLLALMSCRRVRCVHISVSYLRLRLAVPAASHSATTNTHPATSLRQRVQCLVLFIATKRRRTRQPNQPAHEREALVRYGTHGLVSYAHALQLLRAVSPPPCRPSRTRTSSSRRAESARTTRTSPRCAWPSSTSRR